MCKIENQWKYTVVSANNPSRKRIYRFRVEKCNDSKYSNHVIPLRYDRTFFSDTLACDSMYYAISEEKSDKTEKATSKLSLLGVKMPRPWRVMHCERDAADIHRCALGRRPFLSLSRQLFFPLSTLTSFAASFDPFTS